MTIKISRMELADLGEPVKLATAIIDQIPDLPIPVPVEEIAYALDITDIRELETDGFEGGLIAFADKSEGIILINRSSMRQRQRFSAGHELGHFVNPWHQPKDGGRFLCSAADMRLMRSDPSDRLMQMEVEANRFSAELLLPRKYVKRDLRRMAGADLEHVLTLARRYDMSKEATARRYVDLCGEPCAIVVSRHENFLRCYRGQGFPYVPLKKGEPLPEASVSVRNTEEQGTVSNWEEVDAGIWTNRDQRSRPSLVLEQTVAQQSGFRMTLLALDDASEDDDDEVDLEESWAIRFRR